MSRDFNFSSSNIYENYVCRSVFVCCPEWLLYFFLSDYLLENTQFPSSSERNAGSEFEVKRSRDPVHHERRIVNGKKDTFADYRCIDASEKPPHESVKTFLRYLSFFLIVVVSITSFFFVYLDFMQL